MSQEMSDKSLAERFYKACQDAISPVRPAMADPYNVLNMSEAIQNIVDADGIDKHIDLKPYFDAINSVDQNPEDLDIEDDQKLAAKVISYLYQTKQTPGVKFVHEHPSAGPEFPEVDEDEILTALPSDVPPTEPDI